MKRLSIFALLLACLWAVPSHAACTDTDGDGNNGTRARHTTHVDIFTGSCTLDDEVIIQTGDTLNEKACLLTTTAGAADVFVSLDGTNYSTAALKMQDYGASDTTPALVTVAGRVYGFVARFWKIRVTQNGATDASAVLVCWDD